MGKLKVLPASIANMIAAGEVVQRPASAVKELMENAVDAGASQVTVTVTDAGRTLIQVIDNGCGMSATDAVLCFERHATSKIASAEDLNEILTYGFRGEALASIASIAEITLKTRREGDDSGTQVRVEDFGHVTSAAVSCPVGSNFAIRNIFYNTPARRKFLKSDNVEFKHIVEEFTRVAITRPEIGFSLSHNGRDVFVLKKAKSLKFRILDLMGSNVTGDLVDIEAKTSQISISGFVGRPDTAKKTLGNQYLFVNGRYFRSAYFHKAIMKAYEELMPEGLTPSYFIFLEVDPGSMDVNIHPTKTEIKFEDDSLIFQTLYACVRETLGRNSFGASIDFDTEGALPMPQFGSSFDAYRPEINTPAPDFDPDYNPFTFNPSRAVEKREDYGRLFEQKTLPTTQILTLQDRYIVSATGSGLMVVNIARARERIIYERMLKAFSANSHVTQTALFPVQVQVGAAQRLLFDEHAQMLRLLGFDITPAGTDSVEVGGVPEGYSCEPGKVQRMILDLQLILSEDCSSLPEMMHSAMAERFAMLGAANSQAPASPFEAQQLIDDLFNCENSEFTSTGRRIATILPLEEIEKNFK